MTRLTAIAALAAACAPDAEPVGPSAPAALAVSVERLPDAVTGEVYQGALEASGGAPPYTWALDAGDLPEALSFNPAGVISGRPLDAAELPLTVTVRDAEGATDTATLTLSVLDAEARLACGETVEGAWTEGAVGEWGQDLDLEVEGGVARLWIAPPAEPTTRLEVWVWSDVEAYGFVGEAGAPLDSDDPSDFPTALWMQYGDDFTIDLLTSPDLESWRAGGQPIPLALAGTRPGGWTATATCTDGPVLRGLSAYPVAVGEALTFNAGAANETGEHTFALDGELPDWATFDPATGRIEGVAEEAGGWDFDLTATAPDGATRTEAAGFGVYEVLALPCGAETTVRPEESYSEGDLRYWNDPRGYAVLRTDLSDPTISAVSVTATASGWGWGSLAAVPPVTSAPFYGSLGAGTFDEDAPYTLTASVADAPSLDDHRRARGGLQIVLTADSLPDDGAGYGLSVACDHAPRLVTRVPVLAEGEPAELALEAGGGSPPVTWTAAAPPDGVTVTPDGVLQVEGLPAGTFLLDLALTDAEARVGAATATLRVGADAACEGVPRIACGETVTGSLSSGYWSDPAAGTGAWCMAGDHDGIDQLTLTLEHQGDRDWQVLALGDDGPAAADAGAGLDFQAWARPGERVAEVLRSGSSPDLDLWRGHPLAIAVVGYDPGDYALTARCE